MADDLQSKATDMVKKILTVGIGAVFLTEESLRTLIGDFKLPKEFMGALLDSAHKTKNEFLGKLSSDIMEKINSKLDPVALAQELLQRNEIELNIKMKFKPKSESSSVNSEKS